MTSPIRPTDDDARALARRLLGTARFASLGVRVPPDGHPLVTRIGVAPGADGLPLALMSDLSNHTRALQVDPVCALLIGEPEDRGDPLTYPRLSLMGRMRFVRHGAQEHAPLAERYLRCNPKARLYIGFADFALAVMDVSEAHLNAGFGQAYRLAEGDLKQPLGES